ncbi:MAG TPA: DUF1361 domain-containing protein [Candidatus Saccharimonadales bacterium]|jgi:uncharacterized membrane protein
MVEVKRRWPELSGTLLLASCASLGLFAAGVIRNNNYGYSYMVWNLFLAWLPLLLMVWLVRILRDKRWSSWQGIAVSVAWLGFLPNSFYMITDYIHLQDTPRVDVLFDAVMLTSFVCTGLVLGYMSLYMFHVELRRRVPARSAARLIAFIIFLCSFAIYLGRDLRWNTWDLFVNPAGILFDVSDRLINPRAHPQMFVTILSFFLLLSVLYLLVWNVIHTLRPLPRR